MPDKEKDYIDSLLDEPVEEEAPVVEGEKPDEGSPKPEEKEEKEVKYVSEEDHKNLQEKLRQLTEENKSLGTKVKEFEDFQKRLTGDPEEEKAKKSEFAEREEYENDPLKSTKELVSKSIAQVEDKLSLAKAEIVFDKAMMEIDKEWVVDWEGSKDKIIAELQDFSPEARKKKPKDVLLKACRNAGVLKKREKKGVPFVEGADNSGFIQKQNESEAIKIRDRIKNAGKRERLIKFS